jgi:hypothetical protein
VAEWLADPNKPTGSCSRRTALYPFDCSSGVDTLDAREAPMVYRTNQYPLEDALPSVELNTGPRGAGSHLVGSGSSRAAGRMADAPGRRGVIADSGGWCRVWSQAAMNSWGELLSRPQQQAHIRLTQEWRSVMRGRVEKHLDPPAEECGSSSIAFGGGGLGFAAKDRDTQEMQTG